MKNLIRKLFFLSVLAVSIVGLAYTLVLYADRQIDGLQALLCTEIGTLSILWFAFQLREAAEEEEDWPLSIQPRHQAAMRTHREHRRLWGLHEQKAA